MESESVTLEKILSTLELHADKLGGAAGYLGTFANVASAEKADFWQVLKARHINAIKNLNLKKLGQVPDAIMYDPNWGGFVWGGVGAFIVGWVAKSLDIEPRVSRIAEIAKKAGLMAALAGVGATVVGKIAEKSGGSELRSSSSSSSPEQEFRYGR